MTKKFSAKRSLIASILILCLCITSLVGATFAWFTDEVTSANNVIQTGKLDIKVEYTLDGATWNDLDGADDLFQQGLWEPGHTEVVALRISNIGTLELKYLAKLNLASEVIGKTEAGEDIVLSDILTVSSLMANADTLGEQTVALAFSAEDGVSYGVSATFNNTDILGEEKVLAPEDAHYLIVKVDMDESVGNEANHDGVNIPSINFGINVLATQYTAEYDSFNNEYDKYSVYPDGAYRIPVNKNITVSGTAGETLVAKNENDSFSVKATAGDQGTIKAEVTTTGPSENAFLIADENDLNLLSYDIKVTGQEAGSEVEVTLYLGKALSSVAIYHNGDMLDTSEYSYDPVSGYITFVTTSFSTFDITFGGEANILSTFEDISAARGADGKHVLGADMTPSNIIFFGNGTDNELFLNGKTVTAGNPGQYIMGSQSGSKLTVSGNGTVNAGKGFMASKGGAEIVINGGNYNFTKTGTLNNIKHCSLAQNNSKIVVNDGTFTTDVVDAVLFFATSNAVIEINGGFFENTADDTPDLLSMGTNKSNTNRIILKGGTFVNYNPLEDRMCYTGEWPESYEQFSGPWMLVWDGYTVVSEVQENGDVWYSEVPVSETKKFNFITKTPPTAFAVGGLYFNIT